MYTAAREQPTPHPEAVRQLAAESSQLLADRFGAVWRPEMRGLISNSGESRWHPGLFIDVFCDRGQREMYSFVFAKVRKWARLMDMQTEIYRRYLQEMLQVYFLKNWSFSFSSQVRFLAILISMLSSSFFPPNLYFSLSEVSELDVLPQLGTYWMEWYGWSCLVLVTFTFLLQHHDDIDLHSLNFCSTPQPFSTQLPVILHFVLPFLN